MRSLLSWVKNGVLLSRCYNQLQNRWYWLMKRRQEQIYDKKIGRGSQDWCTTKSSCFIQSQNCLNWLLIRICWCRQFFQLQNLHCTRLANLKIEYKSVLFKTYFSVEWPSSCGRDINKSSHVETLLEGRGCWGTESLQWIHWNAGFVLVVVILWNFQCQNCRCAGRHHD